MNTSGSWYLVQCKPRQDERAEEHLLRQGYTCYRPTLRSERLRGGRRLQVTESLFPGYLFTRLAPDGNWSALRSTRGVSRLVSFGHNLPHPVDDALIENLRRQEGQAMAPVLQNGDRVRVVGGSFTDIEAIFLSMDGEERVVLLMNILNRQQEIRMPLKLISRR